MRQVALIILYDEDKRLLLQHRSEDAPTLPGFWGFFGGDIEADETPLEAVHREAREEIEYELLQPMPLIAPELVLPNGRIKAFIYIEKLRTAKSRLVLREGQGMGWFKPPEHHSLKMMDHDKTIIEQVSNHLNGM
jgi:8-oxo-dGTP pyrophosphatase MutT (NUDIX family)